MLRLRPVNDSGISSHRERPVSGSVRGERKVIELPRSTYYYRSHSFEHGMTDARLTELIGEVHDEFPGYGYRRVTGELAAREYPINPKRVARVMRQYDLGAIHRPRFVRTTTASMIAQHFQICIAIASQGI